MADHATDTPGRGLDSPGLDDLEREPGAPPTSDDQAGAPGAAAAPPAPPMFDKNDARFFIDAGLDFVGSQLDVAYSVDTREKGAERLAAVLEKYADRLPLWLIKYREEFMLGSWFAGLMFKTWKLHAAAQAQERARASGPGAGSGARGGTAAQAPGATPPAQA